MLTGPNKNFNSMKNNNIETIKKTSEIKNIITEKKNTLEGINSKLDEVEDQLSNFKAKVAENTQSGQ